MITTVKRRKVEILADQPLLRRIIALAEECGVTGHSVLPVVEGSGQAGRWTHDDITGAETKVMVVTITTEEQAGRLLAALAPLLASHGLLVWTSEVEVIRAEKY